MRFGKTIFAVLLAGVCAPGIARAQPAIGEPAPLSAPRPARSAVEISAQLRAAQSAHDFGQFSVAQDSYREMLGASGVDQTMVKLALASVLIDAGSAADAEAVLATVSEPRTAAWHLRAGLAALELRKRDVAQASWDAIKPAELSEADRPWHVFLEGALYDLLPTPDTRKANELYRNAENAATTEIARARFQLAAERVRLRLEPPSPERLEETRQRAEEDARRSQGLAFENGRLYAVMLVQVNRRDAALTYLLDQVLRGRNAEARDEFNFLIGLIGDRSRGGQGRNALFQLLRDGTKPERQRQALELLAAASATGLDRTQFRNALDGMIAAPSPHPIKETLLYYRAQLALADREYVTAESDAEQLLRDYPASRLRIHAFGVLTQSMWEQQLYLRAASYAHRAREALQAESAPASPAARFRAELGVFEAEAYFRAGLLAERLERLAEAPGKVAFSSAASAYAALLRERPPELDAKKLGDLMYQCVLAEIKARSADAEKRLNEFENDPAFDLENRWDAEWSLARAAKVRNDIASAYARISRLLEENPAGAAALAVPLRAKMAWLRAQLAFDARQPERAVQHAEQALGALGGLDEGLHREIASTLLSLKAQAEFALGREPVAKETLARLRAEFAQTEAAIDSYLIEAQHHADQGKIDVAQRTLTTLVDNRAYAASPNIPLALFRLARLSEQLGSEQNLRAANNRIEELLQHPAVTDSVGLIFRARMEQGDIFMELNDYPRAIQAYDELLNRHPSRPEIAVVQLRSARAYNALSSADRRNAEIAKGKFEDVFYRAGASDGVRLEAGYNLGALLALTGKLNEASQFWWSGIIAPEMEKPSVFADSDPKVVYWLGRTLLQYGELQEKKERPGEAADAYRLVIRKNLGTEAVTTARDRLQKLGAPAP